MEKILIAGGTGLVGQRFVELYDKSKYQIHILTRGKTRIVDDIHYINWRPYDQDAKIDTDLDFDYVVNLTGAGIADENWTDERKKILLESRTITTQALCKYFGNKRKTKHYIGASAIGFYGDRGQELLYESSPPQADNFMSKICTEWEHAHLEFADKAEDFSVLRIGIVLSTKDGALPKMQMSVPLGVSPYLGSGDQYYSWIHIDDLCQIMLDLIGGSLKGAVYNASSPNPNTAKSFSQGLKRAINRFSLVIPVPAMGIKAVFGEMSATVLASTRVSADKIQKAGFQFQFPELVQAVKDVRKRKI